MVSGKLGGTGNELVTAYQIFRATETLPNREVLLDSINRILSTTGYDQMNLGIVEEDINLESIKGANTEDV
jgi:imidazole glycerol phosphate synthase subunit HisF